MTEDQTRATIAIIATVGFLGFIGAVLFGVRIESPELAKFTGAVFGYLGGIITMIFTRYFRTNGGSTP